MLGRYVFSTASRFSYEYQLCSPTRRLVPLFTEDRLYTGTSPEKRKEANPVV